MEHFLRQPVFAVAGRTYCWADVVRAADLRGDWEALVGRTRRSLASLVRAAEGQGARLPAADLDEAARRFRIARGLVTAREAEAWLERWGLGVERWYRALEAKLLRERSESSGPGAPSEELPADAVGLEDAILAEAIVEGDLGRFAGQLAGQAAIASRLKGEGGGQEEGLDPIAAPGPLARMLDRYREIVLAPGAAEAHLKTHQEAFTRVVYKELRLNHEEMAREAQLSIREDGRSVSSIAAAARVAREERRVFLGDLHPSLAARLFLMPLDELSETVREGDEYVLYLLVDKTLPALADDEVRARVEADIVRRQLSREMEERVRWLFPL